MMLTLAWKEIREHRSIWLTMVIMTGLMGFGFAQLMSASESAGTAGITVLAMAATFGVVCGSMMFAGEREGGTLVFLDIFLGRRGLLWSGKLFIGLMLAITQALAVALALHLMKQAPPDWMATLIGRAHWSEVMLGPGREALPTWEVWFIALPMVTLEAFAWGLLGSSITQRVLTSAALAVLVGVPIWLATAFVPPPACIVLRSIVFLFVLLGSCAIFMSQIRDNLSGPPPVREDPKRIVMREVILDMYRDEPITIVPIDDPPPIEVGVPLATALPKIKPRRTARPPQAESPSEVLLWLTAKQATIPCLILGGAALFVGFFVPVGGQILWPIATLLLGIGCGTATFAWEQADSSYQFLAAQHFPLTKVWNVKVLFWFTAAIMGALFLLVTGGLLVLLSLAVARPNAGQGAAPTGFDFGTLQPLLGPVQFFGIWLAYGFCVAGIFVFLCRKTVYAVIISAMVAVGAVGLWLPSMVCRGMGGWQMWVLPIALVLTMRTMVRTWAGGRIQERKPLLVLIGIGLAALLWVGVNFGYRAYEIPDVGAPMDRAAYRASIPTGKANDAAQKIQEALEEIKIAVGPKDVWLLKMAEVQRLPLGVIENPLGEGQMPSLRHVPGCADMAFRLRERAAAARAQNQHAVCLERLGQILALSRNLRHKAPQASYLAGIEAEWMALEELDAWLAQKPLPIEIVQKTMEELNRHVAETPTALDCLQTECYRGGGALNFPTVWSFYSGARGMGRVPEPWLAGGIAMALETPWEAERKARLWQLVWAGHFRAINTPYWQVPAETALDARHYHPWTIDALKGWLPAEDGPGKSLGLEQVARLLDASWLADDRLFTPAVTLRNSATLSRCRVEARRLTAALCLYQLREGKAATHLAQLAPKYLPELPVDPFSGNPFGYRVSAGEDIETMSRARPGQLDRQRVPAGHVILWSAGPDRADAGGSKDCSRLALPDPRWPHTGFDVVTVVPKWQP